MTPLHRRIGAKCETVGKADISVRWTIVEGTITQVVVVVPAHNEVANLPGCIASVRVAAAAVPVPVLTVVVLDHCDDGSEDLSVRRRSRCPLLTASMPATSAPRGLPVSRWRAGFGIPTRSAPGTPTPTPTPGSTRTGCCVSSLRRPTWCSAWCECPPAACRPGWPAATCAGWTPTTTPTSTAPTSAAGQPPTGRSAGSPTWPPVRTSTWSPGSRRPDTPSTATLTCG